MISILISMIPEAAADHLMDKYDGPSKTLEEMEDVLTEYLMKKEDKGGDKKKRAVAQVSSREEGEKNQEESWKSVTARPRESFGSAQQFNPRGDARTKTRMDRR